MEPPVQYSAKPCDKLFHISTTDFGFPGGKTCKWRTKYCSTICYGLGGRTRTPKIRAAMQRRLDFIAGLSGDAVYHLIVGAFYANGAPFRIGRYGDVRNVAQTEATIKALLETEAPFMWTTRAWREPSHPSWRLIDKFLPGGVYCSMDVETVQRGERPPSGWPVAYIATPPYYDFSVLYEMGYKPVWCAHYPRPDTSLAQKAVYNCRECMLCYAPAGGKRADIVFMQHSDRPHRIVRRHYPESYWRKRWTAGKPLASWDPSDPPEAACGVVTPYGWDAPDDNA